MFEIIDVDEPVFRIDLHSVRGGDRVATRLAHAVGPVFEWAVQPGCWVRILDEDDGTVSAIVERLEDRRVHLKIDWGTWQPSAQPLPESIGTTRFRVAPDLTRTG